jgi:hypothetical protein
MQLYKEVLTSQPAILKALATPFPHHRKIAFGSTAGLKNRACAAASGESGHGTRRRCPADDWRPQASERFLAEPEAALLAFGDDPAVWRKE